MNITNKLDKHIKNAIEKQYNELTGAEQFIHILYKFGKGKNIKNDCFGSDDEKTSLDINDIRDNINCHNCDATIDITSKNVPMILRFYENVSNGMGASLRTLRNLGIKYNKFEGKKITFSGRGNPKEYTQVPVKIKKHFENIVSSGKQCVECYDKLYGISFKGDGKNWEVDHKYSETPEKYKEKVFKNDKNNYQLLCKSCNAAKRELEKKRKNG